MQKRVRYNSSNIDTRYTEKGLDFRDIPELYMIYLTKTDVFGGNRTVYHVERTVRETGETVDNGIHEVYINARVDDGTEIARMMRYFRNTQGEEACFPRVSGRIRYLKEEEKGVEEMCEAVEQYAKERAEREAREVAKKVTKEVTKDVARENARRCFENGLDFDVVANIVIQLTREELQDIYRNGIK